MTITIVLLAVALVASPAGCLYVVLRYITARDERDLRDRQILLNRIQAPETAIAQTISDDLPVPERLPFDDDTALMAVLEAS